MANTLRVNQLSFDTVAPRESLCDTLPELEAFEVNDLLMITQSLTAVRNNCEDLKNTAVSTEWLPVTLVPGSMSDGLFGLRYTIPTPESPCNSLAALHSPLWQLASYENGGDTVPRLQEAALQLYSCRVQLLHQSHTGNCGNPHWNTVQS